MSSKVLAAREIAAMTADEAAAYWFVRHDSGSLNAEEDSRFQEWLTASDVHRRAYQQTNEMWTGFADAADVGELRALRVAALSVGPAPKVWPRAAGLAAAALIVIGLVGYLWRQVPPADVVAGAPPMGQSSGASHYVTAHNQRSTLTLSDGTVVSMNLDTALDTDFSQGRRLVHLLRGQAFFEVAKDKSRQFVVSAGDRRIEALGTQFDVRVDSHRVEVVLVEGRVSVDSTAVTVLDRLRGNRAHVVLQPGQRLVARSGTNTVSATNAAEAASWREGWITFQDQSLEEAVAELNRYSDRPLVVDDAAVKRLRISGVFRIGQPERFGAILEELLPVTAEPGADGETRLRFKDAGR